MTVEDDRTLRAVLETVRELAPQTPIADALETADKVLTRLALPTPPTELRTMTDLIAFARSQHSVMSEIGRKIHAIKNLRAAVSELDERSYADWGGLKQCKDAIEHITGTAPYPSMT